MNTNEPLFVIIRGVSTPKAGHKVYSDDVILECMRELVAYAMLEQSVR